MHQTRNFFYVIIKWDQRVRINQDLRWLKPVLTLSRDLVIRRINTTTLYHVIAMLRYHVKNQLLLNEMQLFTWCNKLPWKQESLAKTHYILALAAHIWKNELGNPSFLLQKSDQHARINFYVKFKKVLQREFRTTLNFQLFKVAMKLFRRILIFYFTKTTKSFSAIISVWCGSITLVLNDKVL